MGYLWFIAAPVGLGLLIAATIISQRWRRAQRQRDREAAIAAFSGQRQALSALFLQAAAASGKPRGLRWTSCELSGAPLFAVDDQSGELVALVAATVSFAAIEGGGMEEVEAVGNLRSATAVFLHRGEGWFTDGRVIFNLEPQEALAKFPGVLRRVD